MGYSKSLALKVSLTAHGLEPIEKKRAKVPLGRMNGGFLVFLSASAGHLWVPYRTGLCITLRSTIALGFLLRSLFTHLIYINLWTNQSISLDKILVIKDVQVLPSVNADFFALHLRKFRRGSTIGRKCCPADGAPRINFTEYDSIEGGGF